MQARLISNSQPCCFASLWQINPSCGFCASVCACSAHGICQSLLLFLNEIHWEMRAYLIWSLRGSIRPVSLYHTHRRKRKSLFLRYVRSSWMHTHTHAGSIHKDQGRHKGTDTYAHVQDIFYYSNTLMHSNEHSLPSSFRQIERERDINLKKRKRWRLAAESMKKVECMSRVEGESKGRWQCEKGRPMSDRPRECVSGQRGLSLAVEKVQT